MDRWRLAALAASDAVTCEDKLWNSAEFKNPAGDFEIDRVSDTSNEFDETANRIIAHKTPQSDYRGNGGDPVGAILRDRPFQYKRDRPKPSIPETIIQPGIILRS